MFDNIGGKIKGLAKVLCLVGIAVSAIGAIALWCANSYYQSTIVPGFIVLIVGSVGSWLSSLFTYGFGELIDRVTSIDEKQASQSFYLQTLSESHSTIIHSLSLLTEHIKHSLSLLTEHIKQDSDQTPSKVNQPSESNAKSNTAIKESTGTKTTTNSFSVSELQFLKKMHEEGNLSDEEYQACLDYKGE